MIQGGKQTMNTIKVRNLEIGTGMPKICVPIVGKTVPEILENAKSAVQAKADVVEWRVDWYEDVFSFECVEHVLRKLCEITGEIPLLFTFRTLQEGGEQAIELLAYQELNERAAGTKLVDLIDAELSSGEETVKKEEQQQFYDEEAKAHKYLVGYEKWDKRQLRKMTHIERFGYRVTEDVARGETVLLFDYQNRNPLNYEARVVEVCEMEEETVF